MLTFDEERLQANVRAVLEHFSAPIVQRDEVYLPLRDAPDAVELLSSLRVLVTEIVLWDYKLTQEHDERLLQRLHKFLSLGAFLLLELPRAIWNGLKGRRRQNTKSRFQMLFGGPLDDEGLGAFCEIDESWRLEDVVTPHGIDVFPKYSGPGSDNHGRAFHGDEHRQFPGTYGSMESLCAYRDYCQSEFPNAIDEYQANQCYDAIEVNQAAEDYLQAVRSEALALGLTDDTLYVSLALSLPYSVSIRNYCE